MAQELRNFAPTGTVCLSDLQPYRALLSQISSSPRLKLTRPYTLQGSEQVLLALLVGFGCGLSRVVWFVCEVGLFLGLLRGRGPLNDACYSRMGFLPLSYGASTVLSAVRGGGLFRVRIMLFARGWWCHAKPRVESFE